MRMRMLATLVLSPLVAACASGSSGVSSLAYPVPPASASYLVADTVTISLQGLGQPMEIAARSIADYRLDFVEAPVGLRVTATVEELQADVVVPMADPLGMDESGLDGSFSFVVDRMGRLTEMASPTAVEVGGQVFSAPVVGHTLFPRVAGRAGSPGESWVDSVTYSESGDAGETRVTSSLTYEVVGTLEENGRRMLEITFGGSGQVVQDLSVEGARISQSSEVEIEGHLLWDTGAGLAREIDMTMEGPGSVRVALLPGAALPTTVRWRSSVRLQDR